MPAIRKNKDLWSLVLESITIDPSDLTAAVDTECRNGKHDFRTRMLIRESLLALAGQTSETAIVKSLSCVSRPFAEHLLKTDLGEVGFPSLPRRLMNHTRPDKVIAFLRELGSACRSPARIDVGGSIALILRDLLDRFTEDVDAVDEVPPVLRSEHELFDRLVNRFNLRLTHFQSHYLPVGWANRVSSFGVYGQLTVFLVDPVDIFVGKIFSRREKDLDDLRMLKPLLDWPTIVERLQTTAGPLRSIDAALAAAKHNWYVLTGEELPLAK